MLAWTIALFVIALIFGLFGFTGLAASASWLAQILFIIVLVGALASLITSMVRRRK